jgi:predicted RNase H-like nuclease (RuvC/YqgF family)
MSSKSNLRLQIQDIDQKIVRLEQHKSLLNDKLKRKEQHSSRIKLQNRNDQASKEYYKKNNGLELETSNRFSRP